MARFLDIPMTIKLPKNVDIMLFLVDNTDVDYEKLVINIDDISTMGIGVDDDKISINMKNGKVFYISFKIIELHSGVNYTQSECLHKILQSLISNMGE